MKSQSDWQLSPCAFTVPVKKKKKNPQTCSWSLLGELAVGRVMLLERKRRGASGSFGALSEPPGCRMWGKCENKGAARDLRAELGCREWPRCVTAF